ncbi:hypothetical protein ACNFH8_28885 [Pseudomonas sp. NY15436]|uniref:hypothetical protein n=1 Tax=Pseudomonas sp. NY15436 TaxID=3400359 RepID=UPI003A8992F5
MKVSELIRDLQAILDESGDVEMLRIHDEFQTAEHVSGASVGMRQQFDDENERMFGSVEIPEVYCLII